MQREADLLLKLTGFLVVHCAAHRHAGAQNLFDSACKLPCTAALPHYPCNLCDLVQCEVATVPDILLL